MWESNHHGNLRGSPPTMQPALPRYILYKGLIKGLLTTMLFFQIRAHINAYKRPFFFRGFGFWGHPSIFKPFSGMWNLMNSHYLKIPFIGFKTKALEKKTPKSRMGIVLQYISCYPTIAGNLYLLYTKRRNVAIFRQSGFIHIQMVPLLGTWGPWFQTDSDRFGSSLDMQVQSLFMVQCATYIIFDIVMNHEHDVQAKGRPKHRKHSKPFEYLRQKSLGMSWVCFRRPDASSDWRILDVIEGCNILHCRNLLPTARTNTCNQTGQENPALPKFMPKEQSQHGTSSSSSSSPSSPSSSSSPSFSGLFTLDTSGSILGWVDLAVGQPQWLAHKNHSVSGIFEANDLASV